MLFNDVIKTRDLYIRACKFVSLQRKVFLRKDKSTAVFPIVLENEEPVYLCFCSSFDDSIVDYGRRLHYWPYSGERGKGNILERKHSNTTKTIISNRFTKKTNARKKHIG